jgi:hypothetical protein
VDYCRTTSAGEPKNKRDWRKESFLFELRSGEFERFSQSNASFLSEAGGVLIFFCFVFLYQDKKMKKHFIKKKVQRKNKADAVKEDRIMNNE